MDHFEHLKDQVRNRLLAALLVSNALILGIWLLGRRAFHWPDLVCGAICLILAIIVNSIIATWGANTALKPLGLVWQAVLHVSPTEQGTPPPDMETIKVGRELITSLIQQVYQFASHEDSKELIAHRTEVIQAVHVVDQMPLPLFVFNKQLQVTNASESALAYCQLESAKLFGKPLFDNLNLSFPTEATLEAWIKQCQTNKATDTAYWERVRVELPDKQRKQCDMAGYYNRDNPSGTEFIVVLFDRTKRYQQDDNDLGFVAVAVHELRTPLTMLKGYIEVFQEAFEGKLDPELTDFMHKMEASAQMLSAFVANILNVARIEDNQLILHLSEAPWSEVVHEAATAMELRARVYGKKITYEIAPDLPTVAVDQVTISEVINNLLDNAIKYSGQATDITVTARIAKDGMVETLVSDHGVGIPASAMPNLFEKFYRNHRTRGEIGGTGLGLYLCKSIVTAHGGNIWANSKEGQGTTIGFTVQPFAQLAEEQKNGDSDIVRQSHGWIKNHSIYRR